MWSSGPATPEACQSHLGLRFGSCFEHGLVAVLERNLPPCQEIRGLPENKGPYYSTLNSRNPDYKDPKPLGDQICVAGLSSNPDVEPAQVHPGPILTAVCTNQQWSQF